MTSEAAKLSAQVVSDYMQQAIIMIDMNLGSGYAERNPALLSGFIQAMVMEREGAGIRQELDRVSS